MVSLNQDTFGGSGHTDDVMSWHTNSNFVKYGRNEEDGKTGSGRAPASSNHGHIDVTLEICVDRLVPCSPISTQAFAIPPVVVK